MFSGVEGGGLRKGWGPGLTETIEMQPNRVLVWFVSGLEGMNQLARDTLGGFALRIFIVTELEKSTQSGYLRG
jgi:hypothetical protein